MKLMACSMCELPRRCVIHGLGEWALGAQELLWGQLCLTRMHKNFGVAAKVLQLCWAPAIAGSQREPCLS